MSCYSDNRITSALGLSARLCGLEMVHGIGQMFGRVSLFCVDGGSGRLSNGLGFFAESGDLGLPGAVSLGGGIADRLVQLLPSDRKGSIASLTFAPTPGLAEVVAGCGMAVSPGFGWIGTANVSLCDKRWPMKLSESELIALKSRFTQSAPALAVLEIRRARRRFLAGVKSLPTSRSAPSPSFCSSAH
jgi:hypothetical protein